MKASLESTTIYGYISQYNMNCNKIMMMIMMLVKHFIGQGTFTSLIILINKTRLSEGKHKKGLNENQAFSGKKEDFCLEHKVL